MGIKINLPDEVLDIFTAEVNPKCELQAGDRVEKITWEVGDMHPKGTQGTVIGSVFDNSINKEIDLIQMDTDPEGSRAITMPYKFKKI